MRNIARSIGVPLLVAALVMIFMAPVVLAAPGAPGGGVNSELAAARRATAKYHDVSTAIADGYVPVSHHVPGMGVHYLRLDPGTGLPDIDPIFDATRPEILLYSLAEGNRPKLVAVEYVVAGDVPGDPNGWVPHEATCHYADLVEIVESDPFSCPGTSPGGAPFVLWHPDLWTRHTWIWRGNPDGIFEPINPNVP